MFWEIIFTGCNRESEPRFTRTNDSKFSLHRSLRTCTDSASPAVHRGAVQEGVNLVFNCGSAPQQRQRTIYNM